MIILLLITFAGVIKIDEIINNKGGLAYKRDLNCLSKWPQPNIAKVTQPKKVTPSRVLPSNLPV